MAIKILGKGGTLVYPKAPSHDVVLPTIEKLKVNKVNAWGPLHGKLVKAATAYGIDTDKIWGLGPLRDKQGNVIPPDRAPNLLGMSESISAHLAHECPATGPHVPAGQRWNDHAGCANQHRNRGNTDSPAGLVARPCRNKQQRQARDTE